MTNTPKKTKSKLTLLEQFGSVPKGYPARELSWFMRRVGQLTGDPDKLKAKLIEGCEIFGPSFMFYFDISISYSDGHDDAVREMASKYFRYNSVVNEVLEMDISQDLAKLAAHLAPTVFIKKKRHLYLVQSAEGFYKIGITSDLNNRIAGLKTGNPFGVELVHSYLHNEAETAERELHKKFADKRVNREWFRLQEEDVEYIKSFLSDAEEPIC